MKRKLIDKAHKLVLNVDKWYDYVEKYLAITVDDIRKIKGSERFLFIDRNFLDFSNCKF